MTVYKANRAIYYLVMEESDYHLKADPALHQLLEFVEDLEEKHDVEVEYEAGILAVTMPDQRQYVINKHTPSRQIWVSSPYSGAAYFEFADGEWRPKRANTAQNENLNQFITAEIISHIDSH